MENGQKALIAKIAFIIIVVAGLLAFAKQLAEGVAIETLPAWLQPHWNQLMIFLGSGSALTLFAWLRSLSGFAQYFWSTEGKELYDPAKVKKTVAKYIGAIVTVQGLASLLPGPYNEYVAAICTAAFLMLDLASSEIRKLKPVKVGSITV